MSCLAFPRLCALDFETTQSPTGLRAVELALVVVEPNQPPCCHTYLFNPGCPIDPFSQAIHGIHDHDVHSAPSFQACWNVILPLLSGSVLLAHNATFDASVLRSEIERHRLPAPWVEWWCTLRLARQSWPKVFPSYALSYLRRELSLYRGEDHRAESDALAALDLFFRAVEDRSEDTLLRYDWVREHARMKSEKAWPFQANLTAPRLKAETQKPSTCQNRPERRFR